MAKLTITQISIENLGPFLERQTLDLSVKSDRPVILVKALNGSGKTTLLTALQIGLYGYRAINLARRSEYDQLITGLQRKDALGNSVIEVSLEVEHGSAKQAVVVRREWSLAGSSLQENFQVSSNGIADLDFTDNWDEFINGILPVELVQLFLFDGEKIEALANPERLPDLLRRATEVFLGLGGIDALSNDLKAVERRASGKKKGSSTGLDEAQAQVELVDAQLAAVNDRITVLMQRQASKQVDLDQAQRRLEHFRQEAQRNGLQAYQQAAELKSRVMLAEENHQHARNQLVSALEDPLLPLAWLGPLWQRYTEQWQKDRQAEHAAVMVDEFAKRDERILADLAKAAPQAKQAVAALLQQDLSQFRSTHLHTPALLPGGNPAEIEPQLQQALERLKHSVRNVEKHSQALEKAQLSVGQIPAEEQLSGIFEELQFHSKAVSGIEAELTALAKELDEARTSQQHLEGRQSGALERLRVELKENGMALKTLDAAARSKQVLMIFRERLLASKAYWLADMITAEFKQLLRKRNLISRVVVDPISYAVAIEDVHGHALPMERLSAGERQLLAISVLSALIRERKGRFPVVVDTPLARLDRSHREALIHNFFAKVSHQVLVLSTDEEVEGPVYDALQGHMNREYELSFDDNSHSSSVNLQQKQTITETII